MRRLPFLMAFAVALLLGIPVTSYADTCSSSRYISAPSVGRFYAANYDSVSKSGTPYVGTVVWTVNSGYGKCYPSNQGPYASREWCQLDEVWDFDGTKITLALNPSLRTNETYDTYSWTSDKKYGTDLYIKHSVSGISGTARGGNIITMRHSTSATYYNGQYYTVATQSTMNP